MPWKISRDDLKIIGEKLAKELLPFCASIYGVRGKNEPAQFLGSGTFINRNEKVFILTAQHVVQDANMYSQLFHDRGNGDQMFPTQGGWIGSTIPDADLGLVACFEESLDGTDVQFIDCTDISETSIASDALFFVQGYPEQLNLDMPFLREYRSTSLPFIGHVKKVISNQRNEEIMFSIHYPSDVRPQGMSGSAIWNLNLHRVNGLEEWDLSMTSFAGVVQRWLPEDKEIIATKSTTVKEFLDSGIDYFLKTFPRDD